MRSQYTGGQYSLLRVMLGLLVACQFVVAGLAGAHWFLVGMGAYCAVLVALGVGRRYVTVLCACLALWVFNRPGTGLMDAAILSCTLLLLHGSVPVAPFGSWAARGRVDPAGDWKLPRWFLLNVWLLLSAAYAYVGIAALMRADGGESLPLAVALIAFGPLALVRRLRPLLWTLFLGLHVALLALAPEASACGSWLLFHLFAFDPAWIPPLRRDEPTTVFFDGTCGLCHRTTRFLLAEDQAANLRFAPLQGSTFEARRGAREADSFPDSLVVFAPDGEVLVRSAAVLEALARLGGIWRVSSLVLRRVPRPLLDFGYDRVAALRQRLFAPPEQLCPVLPAQLAQRFLP